MLDIDPMPEAVLTVDPVAVVRSLTWVSTVDEAVERIPAYIRDRMRPEVAAETVRTVATHAAALTRSWRLLPPAEAAFLGERQLEGSDLVAVRALSGRLLQAFLDGDGAVAQATGDDERRTAFHYAAALLKQQLALAAFEKARSDALALDGALTGTDRKRVEDFLLSRSMVGPIQTLERAMFVWRRLVESLEGDHVSMTYEEYEQYLIARDLLDVALSLVAPDARAALDSQLRPLDERFFAATRGASVPLRPASPWHPQRWWWFHVPRRPGRAFDEYLQHLVPEAAGE